MNTVVIVVAVVTILLIGVVLITITARNKAKPGATQIFGGDYVTLDSEDKVDVYLYTSGGSAVLINADEVWMGPAGTQKDAIHLEVDDPHVDGKLSLGDHFYIKGTGSNTGYSADGSRTRGWLKWTTDKSTFKLAPANGSDDKPIVYEQPFRIKVKAKSSPFSGMGWHNIMVDDDGFLRYLKEHITYFKFVKV